MRVHVAIITGGSRGFGRAMTLGVAQEGYAVVAVGQIAADIGLLASEIADTPLTERVVPIVADLRHPAECDRVMSLARGQFGAVRILINGAGLTFTYIWPDLYRRPSLPQFWEATDEIVHTVINANYVAADQMARRVAPHMVAQGRGGIVNVTTKLDTMNRSTSGIYGASKAALEMAMEIWAKGTTATGLTINIVNPGAGADTPGMAEEIRDASREGRIAPLLKPTQMLPPLLWVLSPDANSLNGYRFDATLWDSPAEAGRRVARPAGLTLHAALNPRAVAPAHRQGHGAGVDHGGQIPLPAGQGLDPMIAFSRRTRTSGRQPYRYCGHVPCSRRLSKDTPRKRQVLAHRSAASRTYYEFVSDIPTNTAGLCFGSRCRSICRRFSNFEFGGEHARRTKTTIRAQGRCRALASAYGRLARAAAGTRRAA